MAWTYPAWQDVYAFGVPSALRVGMFEFCRAINERELAMNMTKTTFYRTDGTLGSDLAFDDFYAMQITGNGSYFTLNCQRINAAVEALVNTGWFTEESGRSPLWTLASLEEDIGEELTGFPGPTSPRENYMVAAWWQAHQDALDRLRFGKRRLDDRNAAASHNYAKNTIGTILFSTDKEIAWDTMRAEGETDIAFSSLFRFWLRALTSSPNPTQYTARASTVKTTEFATHWAGEIVAVDYVGATNRFAYSGDFDITVNSTLINVGSYATWDGVDPSTWWTVEGDIDDFVINGANPITYTRLTPIPDDQPFTSGPGFGGEIGLGFDVVTYLYFDLTPELTDQEPEEP